MTKEQIGSIERAMVLKLLVALARTREGERVSIEPCGAGKSLEDGFTVNDLSDGNIKYMLYYNVGANTHAVSIDAQLKAE
jgi:hypothetical protein